MDGNPSSCCSKALLRGLLALGLILGGWILGAQIKATRLSDRYVTVKGVVERKVKSDLANARAAADRFAADSSLMKTVRIGTTVQYYLEK